VAIASAALERRESRGGHLRSDRPGIDPSLDGVHIVVGANGEARREEWR
jgi:succinate dehydrogenase/fumarate reductase flavoprotein subunit